MIQCPAGATSVHSSLTLGLRDMRTAHGRHAETGEGAGSRSWMGLVVGMAILDTLTGPGKRNVGAKWLRLLTSHHIDRADAEAIYKLRCSLLHGYHLPKLAGGIKMQLTDDQDTYALDTTTPHVVSVSVPVFCRCLVERIAFKAQSEWDETLIDTDSLDLRIKNG